MHKAIDLGGQALDSAVFQDLVPEAKDYYINRVTSDFLKDVVEAKTNNRFNIMSYEDIRSYYDALGNMMISKTLDVYTYDEKAVYAILPTDTRDDVSSGNLINGVKYIVITVGTTNLSSFGHAVTPVINTQFVCTIANTTPVNDGGGWKISIRQGAKYKILKHTTPDYTPYGASNNGVGTIFTASASALIASSESNDELEVIEMAPTWAGGTVLRPLTTEDYFSILVSRSNIDYGAPFTSGVLSKNKIYKVVTGGSTNLISYGYKEVPYAGDIFLCTANGTPSWDGTTQLVETKKVSNRLLKQQDVYNALNFAFGTSYDSPMSTIKNIEGNLCLVVYHDGKFDINKVYVDYVKVPIDVDYNRSIDSELNVSLHPLIIDKVVSLIAAHASQPNYQQLKVEEKDKQI